MCVQQVSVWVLALGFFVILSSLTLHYFSYDMGWPLGPAPTQSELRQRPVPITHSLLCGMRKTLLKAVVSIIPISQGEKLGQEK